MDLIISIVNANNSNLLKECLTSIHTHTHRISFEIIVIDNASEDDSVKMMEEKFPQVKIIKNTTRFGFAKNHNQVLKNISARYVVILNEDTILLNDALDKMVAFLEENPKVGIVGPKVLNKDKSLQLSARAFPSLDIRILIAGMFHNTFLTKIFPHNPFTQQYLLLDWDHNNIREIDWVSGCCLMVRKDVLDKIGLLDEQFVMFVEDVDFCFRAKREGYKTFYLPSAEIIHLGGAAISRTPIKMIIEHHKSMYKFYKKNYLKGGRLRYLILFGLVLRCSIAILQNKIPYLSPKK